MTIYTILALVLVFGAFTFSFSGLFLIGFDSLLDVLMQAFAILPRFNTVIIAHIDDIENIGQMAAVIPVKHQDIVLG